jgi:predicted transcriptional regulator
LPAATVTETGTVAEEVLLVSFTTKPPVGAAPVNVAVPVEDVRPTTLVGLTVKEAKVAGLMVRVAVWETLPNVAVTVTEV